MKMCNLTLTRSSSFSETLSSADSSSRKGLVGSKGVSGLFCKQRNIKLTSRNLSASFTLVFTLQKSTMTQIAKPETSCRSYPGAIAQGAAWEALSQQPLEIGGPLNSKEQELDLNLPGTSSHQLGQLSPGTQQHTLWSPRPHMWSRASGQPVYRV